MEHAIRLDHVAFYSSGKTAHFVRFSQDFLKVNKLNGVNQRPIQLWHIFTARLLFGQLSCLNDDKITRSFLRNNFLQVIPSRYAFVHVLT